MADIEGIAPPIVKQEDADAKMTDVDPSVATLVETTAAPVSVKEAWVQVSQKHNKAYAIMLILPPDAPTV